MRTIIKALAAAAVLLSGAAAQAQEDFPSKQINIIVPYPPGGLADLLTRSIAEGLEKAWDQTVVVENKPGAGGILGAQTVAAAEPDGHTLLLGNTNIAINPHVYKSLPYDTEKAFAPVVLALAIPNVVVVHQSVGVDTLQGLIDLAKKSPGELNFASASNGSFPHLVIELLKLQAGIDMEHIPYAGAAPALAAIRSGEVDVLASDIPNALQPVKEGQIKALAVTSAERSASMPDVPTMKEAGLRDYEAVGWQGFMAPAGTPEAVIEKINAEINKVMATPTFKERFASAGVTIVGGTPEAFAEFIRDDTARWKAAVDASGTKIE